MPCVIPIRHREKRGCEGDGAIWMADSRASMTPDLPVIRRMPNQSS